MLGGIEVVSLMDVDKMEQVSRCLVGGAMLKK